MKSIPINYAILTWNPSELRQSTKPKRGKPGEVRVIDQLCLSSLSNPRNSKLLSLSEGITNSHFAKADINGKLALLYSAAWHAVIRDGVDPQVIHKTLTKIQEFQQSLADDIQAFGNGK